MKTDVALSGDGVEAALLSAKEPDLLHRIPKLTVQNVVDFAPADLYLCSRRCRPHSFDYFPW